MATNEADSRRVESEPALSEDVSVRARREARRRRIQANAAERLARLSGLKNADVKSPETKQRTTYVPDGEHRSAGHSQHTDCSYAAFSSTGHSSSVIQSGKGEESLGNEEVVQRSLKLSSGMTAGEGSSCPIALTVILAVLVALSKTGMFGEDVLPQNVLWPVIMQGLVFGIYHYQYIILNKWHYLLK